MTGIVVSAGLKVHIGAFRGVIYMLRGLHERGQQATYGSVGVTGRASARKGASKQAEEEVRKEGLERRRARDEKKTGVANPNVRVKAGYRI